MSIRKILSRREELRTKLRNILDGAVDGVLTEEAEARAAAIEAEAEALNVAERRAALLGELDGKADAKPIEQRGHDEPGFALRPEQRMADYVERQTGEPAQRQAFGNIVRGLVTGNWSDVESRVQQSVVGSAGGFLVPAPAMAPTLDLVRNRTVIISAGAMTVPMTGAAMNYAKILTDPAPAWRAESAAIAESDGTYGQGTAHAYSLAALVRFPNELAEDAPNFPSLIENSVASALALELDRVALYGNGVGKPLGLRYMDGVNELSMGDNGLAMSDFDDVLDLLQEIEESNGTATVAIMAPRTKTKLSKLVTGITSDLTKLTPPAEYTALRRLVSNQVSVTETQGSSNVASTMFLGDFSQMAVAIRQDLTVEVSRQADTAFSKNQSLLRCIMRGDIMVFRPSHFGRLIGIL